MGYSLCGIWKRDDIVKRNEDSLFLHLTVEANGKEKAKEIAIEKIGSSMDVLRLGERFSYHWNRYDTYIKDTGAIDLMITIKRQKKSQ